MFRQKKNSIYFRLLTLVFMSSFFSLCIAILIFYVYDYRTFRDTEKKTIDILTSVISQRSRAAIVFKDRTIIDENLSQFSIMENVIYACFFDSDGNIIGQYLRHGQIANCNTPNQSTQMLNHQKKTIKIDNQTLGHLDVYYSNLFLIQRLRYYGVFSLVLIITSSLFVIFFLLGPARRIANPILALNKTTKEFVKDKWDVRADISPNSPTEILQLSYSFNNMLEQLQHKTLEIQYNEAKISSIFNTAADSIINLDKDGNIIAANTATEKITGRSENILSGINYRTLFLFTQSDVIDDFIKTKENSIVGVEAQITHVNGNKHSVELAVSRLFFNKEVIYTIVIHDVTERLNLIDELERKNREIESFTYTVSHDLRSPLVTIRGFLGFLKKDLIENNIENFENDMQHITNATDTMEALLDELLELSRIGRLDNPKEWVDISELITSINKSLAGSIRQKNAHIHVQEQMPKIMVDKARFLQVFQNLIENAIKYMADQKNPKISIGAHCKDAMVECYVKDNGRGIEKQYQSKIFGLFERIALDTTGSGMGLAIVKRILDVHGGKIRVESEGLSHGSCFYLSIPIEGKKASGGNIL